MWDDDGDLDRAAAAFNKATELYRLDNKIVNAHECRLKVAVITARLERFEEAASIFEEVARQQSVEKRFGSRRSYFQASLCRLAGSEPPADARAAIENYMSQAAEFREQEHECNFLLDVSEAIAAHDAQLYRQRVAEAK